MRDLSAFAVDSFDLVYHPYSINFVPDPLTVFAEVRRVLRPNGFYCLGFHNPYVIGSDETEWDGRGYPLRQPYADGEVVGADGNYWQVEQSDGSVANVLGPRAFRHTFSTLVNGLAGAEFVIFELRDKQANADIAAVPGSWDHYCAIAPPFLTLWCRLSATNFSHR
jgi:SAM-dependent methyltransferase